MSNKPKLLFVVEAMGGGVFTYLVDMANELISRFDVYVAYGLREETPSDYADYFDKNVTLIKVENFARSVGLQDIKAFFELKRMQREVRPDVIHLHSSKAGVLGRWAFNGKKIPLFYTPHGYSFLMSNQSKRKRDFYKFVEKVSAKRSCTTISCSAGEHKETLGLTKRATYVNNGINIRQLQQMADAVEKKEHSFTVFTLGRICHQKNPELFNAIAESLPEVQFVWIGDGELREKLTAGNIQITGWVDRKAAVQYAVNADVFLLPSLWEGLPMSLLEAMYLKKLCVVSDVIGNRDVIHTGENGFVCKEREEFVRAIQEARADNAGQMIERAYEEIENRYNTTVMTQRYGEIYQEAISRFCHSRQSGK